MYAKEIVVEKRENIGWIILNQPDRKNTFTREFAVELNNALLSCDDDEAVEVVVISAQGKHFSVGIDLGEFHDKTPREYREFLSMMDKHNHTIASMKKLVLASVHGYAVANGAGVVFASDLAIAAESARFGTTAVNVGLICSGPAVPLSRIVGRKKAMEMVLAGEIYSAEEARRLGLINWVVPDDSLEDETMNRARSLAKKSRISREIGKRAIYGVENLPYHEAAEYSTELFASLCATHDAEEGVSAFLEKRDPDFKGF
ncbi:MAG: enoyl-CoA hydratase/isomerase family protein [Spirochaetales bacterium]|nr:enoyl-CoA hydratase/isomerase family protein [Spirochaetales bacterium]MCF7937460.1 enoyl-CoA hydratase/isomerase family protein [Spirochaetales bacterium]